MKTLILLTLFSLLPFNLIAYSYQGSWSNEPDIFGNYNFSDSFGNSGTFSSEPDMFGNYHFNFSNGTSGYYQSRPDIFGNYNFYIE